MTQKQIVKQYIIKAPAKINIGLRVLSKRKDGFHNIETIFYPVKLYDTISLILQKINGTENIIRIKTSPDRKINNNSNICYKAVEKYFGTFRPKYKFRVDIRIKKNIPIGAGLGGGSSDAAAVLKILHRHFNKGTISASAKKTQINLLQKIALELGSDVPFFMLSKPAYATGRGEKLRALPGFKTGGRILIVNPGIHVSTPMAYRELKVTGKKHAILKNLNYFDPTESRLMINDFEKVIFKKHPAVEKIKYEMLSLGAIFSLMSGSGSTVYGIFPSGKINAAEKYFKKKSYKVFAV